MVPVTDNLTGLMWLKDGNCISTNYPGSDNDNVSGDGRVTWQHALDFVAGINAGTYPNCGAGYTDWRMSNIKELLSLIDYRFAYPCLSNVDGTQQLTQGDPFYLVIPQYSTGEGYWTSTTDAMNADEGFDAWCLNFIDCEVRRLGKVGDRYVWPVRGGK